VSDTAPMNAGSPPPQQPDTRKAEPASLRSPDSTTLPGSPHNAGLAHPARVYGYWLGGGDHDQADREAAEEVMRHRPEVVAAARANQAFGRRFTWHAASACGIRQFLDIGAGLPDEGATHRTAWRASPACRVAYADSDPLVVDRARSQIDPGSGCVGDYLHADVRDPARLLAGVGASLDMAQPVAVLLLSVLQFVPDEDDPAGIVAKLAAALAPGSLLAISHLTADFAPGPVAASVAAYNALVPVSLYSRTHEEVTELFGGLPLHWPGIVPVTRWRPSFQEAPGEPVDMYGGVVVALPPPGRNEP
jgi:S-adenosyl methyltransferase